VEGEEKKNKGQGHQKSVTKSEIFQLGF